jgi:hypothetical protein
LAFWSLFEYPLKRLTCKVTSFIQLEGEKCSNLRQERDNKISSGSSSKYKVKCRILEETSISLNLEESELEFDFRLSAEARSQTSNPSLYMLANKVNTK